MHNKLLSSSPSIQGAKARDDSVSKISIGSKKLKTRLNKNEIDDETQYDPKCGWCAKFFSLPYNIQLILIYTLLWGSSTSIWCRQVLATYVYQITGDSTEILGFIEAVQGVAFLISTPFAGYFTDNKKRINILRFSGLFGLLVVVPLGLYTLIFVGNKYDENSNYGEYQKLFYKSIYYIWLFSWGICSSFCSTVINTVMTDLIPKGERDFIFSFKWFLLRIAGTIGPLLVIFMFFFLGNKWSTNIMGIVLISGISLWCIPLVFLVFAFNKEELNSISTNVDQNEEELKKIDNIKKSKYIGMVPWIMLAHRLTLSTGAGMTVKFFPIFFEDIIHLHPIALNSIYVAVPLCCAIFTIFMERFANKFGRIMGMIVFKSFAVVCLVVLATVKPTMFKYANVVSVVAYIIRTGAMNCGYALEKALIMDHVPKKNRGKWNAVESIQATIWTASAALGGYLIGEVGYYHIYLITASIYSFAILMLIPLNCITS